MLLLVLVSVILIYLYLKISKIYTHWQRKNIPYEQPLFFFGNMASTVFRQRSMTQLCEDVYASYQDKRYVGLYQFLQPRLLLRDPELIKKITVQEFDSFPDHNSFATKDVEPLTQKNLFNRTIKEGWHDMRSTLSPAFTSSKLRIMFDLIEKCADQFVHYFERQGGAVTLEMKDAFSRFTNDVIATTSFGITCDSMQNQENDFFVNGRDLTNFSGLRSLKFFGNSISPNLMKLFKISMFSKHITDFFSSIVRETIRVREENKIVRLDMIHLLMEARNGRLKSDEENDAKYQLTNVQLSGAENAKSRKTIKITDEDIIAQAIIFFFAGFDTSSTLMSFVAYELALNSEIQRKVTQEIDSTLKDCNEKITYESLLSMKYLDRIISETLRKWPPGTFLDRKSVRPFTIQAENPEEQLLHLETGTVCWIPVFSIHRDPKYFPDPERFDPERFNDENKHKIQPSTYLPFGSGPRNCIGSRFAILECKLIIMKILAKFKIVPVKKTQLPIQISKQDISLVPKGGIWLGLVPRTASFS